MFIRFTRSSVFTSKSKLSLYFTMMKQSACRQLTEPGFWAGVLVVLCTLSMGADVHKALKKPSMPSRVLQRHKRDWKWDTLFVYEEMAPKKPSKKIGKLENTFFNTSSKYNLSGEGANTFFTVNEYGDISVHAKLDREEKSIYKLSASLINKESGKPLDKDDTFVIVVLDINDNSPVFPPDLSGSISESSETGSILMTVNATDADDGSTLNGKIEYKLLNGTDLFYINKERLHNVGEIRLLKNSLDREKQSQYIIAIQAKDLPGIENGNSATTTVTININDVNDNIATFKKGKYTFNVKEDSKPEYEIGVLEVDDKDEIQNKDPTFTIQPEFNEVFHIKLNNIKDGILSLKVPLDYETRNMYKFHVNVDEHTVSKSPDNQAPNLQKRAEVFINVIDVDEPPVFSKTEYNFSFYEGHFSSPIIGAVSAKDPDKTGNKIRYSIEDANCPVAVDHVQGQLSVKRQLDREQQSLHTINVTAHEDVPNGLMSYARVNLKVLDINDNAPEITNGTLHVCESDTAGTTIGTVGAYDKDESSQRFSFTLAKESTNFTLHNHLNNTASIKLKQGGFSTESSMKYELEIEIKDGGTPEQKSINLVQIKVCTCHAGRRIEYCKAFAQTGVSASALLAILLCIVTILDVRNKAEVMTIKTIQPHHQTDEKC
ncbi:cadherin-5-like isoform X3 [Carassius carassius]|uniref:cadherin-5-like isoform X3 n=1 Tax=Carassius carassius TaxID=217509 RepID=UPI00286968DD|nr:cadherin-5-like isoform X3 [Carassius carassius]